MNDDKKTMFKEYAEITLQIKSLEEKKDALNEVLFKELLALEVDQVKSELGTFYFTARKTWTYPTYVKEAEAVHKELKKKAETTGEATFEEKKSLAFKVN